MSIAETTQRQLIRNRIHDITDLAAVINEHTKHHVTVEQIKYRLIVEVDCYAELIKQRLYASEAELPFKTSDFKRCIEIHERLEGIAGQLRELLQESQS